MYNIKILLYIVLTENLFLFSKKMIFLSFKKLK